MNGGFLYLIIIACGTIIKMNSLNELKSRVREIRKMGKSFGEIQKILNRTLPKSTLSDWCKDIKLSVKDSERLLKKNYVNLRRGRNLAIKKAKFLKYNSLKILLAKNKNITKKIDNDIAKLLLATLYLGEGAKRDGILILGSSSTGIIKLFLNLLKKCYGIASDRIKARISYRADQDINQLQKYWSKEIGISMENFYKTKPDPRTIKEITKNIDYKGVCVIHILRSTQIHRELMIIAKTLMDGV